MEPLYQWAEKRLGEHHAPVLLTVNVGLLAIQSLDSGHADRSIAQLASYCSAIMSLGAILMCIILSRHHRNNGHSSDMSSVGSWLKQQVNTQWQGELFVITLSLPSVWFTWGVVMFCVALLWVAFDRTSSITRMVVGIVALPTLAVVSWVIVSAWKHKHRRAYLTGRLSAIIRSQCTRARDSVSTWITKLPSRRPKTSDPGPRGRIEQKLSNRIVV
ncbi:hypothetical protein CERSUDRAFT_116296 [Gelatoporia subvermispora B]|uniref:Uncharacterized protein n=1 Tax=Ceriporiopsis subvermispora (strain B) TaxID=914234 RepID=M2RAW7_CERS8|nr:hypothetical protein CERSUDRAFT_116296 [Gelatoporia subvermispora B]